MRRRATDPGMDPELSGARHHLRDRAGGAEQGNARSRRAVSAPEIALASVRHCEEPTGRANARPMTGSAAKQSRLRHSGMVRKHQTRNLEVPDRRFRVVRNDGGPDCYATPAIAFSIAESAAFALAPSGPPACARSGRPPPPLPPSASDATRTRSTAL